MTVRGPRSARSPLWRLFTVAVIATTSCAGTTTTDGVPRSDPSPELPQQALLTSSMRQEPVPGWMVTVDELGLPADTVVRPVGSVDERGIFIGTADEGWWLVGLDLASGRRLFDPVSFGPIADATDFNCYVNGPPNVLCVRHGSDPSAPSAAWVVDTSTGDLIYDRPTDLRVARMDDQPSLHQIGGVAVATVTDEGVYGVGSSGELTWFVPGNGILATQFTDRVRDVTPSTLLIQGSGTVGDVVFSAADGSVLKPELPPGAELGEAVVYPGGFGLEYTLAGERSTEKVAFFDEAGQKLDASASDGALENGSLDLPMTRTKSGFVVSTIDGRRILELAPSLPSPEARLIGSRYFVATDGEHRVWQQFDVGTGESGKTCEGDSLGYQYIASDGEVAVALTGDSPAQGIDLATCDVLWSLPGPRPDEAKEVWRVGTSLLQRTNDRLFSLVSPP